MKTRSILIAAFFVFLIATLAFFIGRTSMQKRELEKSMLNSDSSFAIIPKMGAVIPPKPKDYLYLKSTIRSMEYGEMSRQDLIFVLNSMVLEIERLENKKQDKK